MFQPQDTALPMQEMRVHPCGVGARNEQTIKQNLEEKMVGHFMEAKKMAFCFSSLFVLSFLTGRWGVGGGDKTVPTLKAYF